MKRRHVVLTLVSTTALVVGGVAPSAIGSTTTAVGKSGTEHFLILSTSETANPTVIGTGPIHARGTDISVNNHRDRFVFPAGALKIDHHASSHTQSFDPKTCVGHATERGTYTVAGGTGRYDDAKGHGSYRLQVYFVGCTPGDPSNIFSLTILASGPLSY